MTRRIARPGEINYWGYAPVSFFAPHQAYSSRQDPLGPLDEFRDMVKALHRAGTGGHPRRRVQPHRRRQRARPDALLSADWRTKLYYILEPDRSRYANYSGTGNTLNANHPIVRRMIVDSLRYWVGEMHVDGFRFDLASILARDATGACAAQPAGALGHRIGPVLAGTKLIAEAWDAAGLYQVGSFVGDSWKEWNGRFRDDVRDFLRGAEGSVQRFADRMIGSPEIYGHKEREPEQSVNFVTCHDGFTLNDLVSYNDKHNEANGEDNRDGANDNRSWNCGVEGPSDDPAVEKSPQSAGEELPHGHPAFAGRADDPDGRRSPPHPGRQQQRLLPGQRNQLVRLDPAREARRRASFFKLLTARRLLRSTEHERQRMSLNRLIQRSEQSLARGHASEPAGLERPLAQCGAYRGDSAARSSCSTSFLMPTGSRSISNCRPPATATGTRWRRVD